MSSHCNRYPNCGCPPEVGTKCDLPDGHPTLGSGGHRPTSSEGTKSDFMEIIDGVNKPTYNEEVAKAKLEESYKYEGVAGQKKRRKIASNYTLPKRENKHKAWDSLLNKWASPTDIRPTDKRPDVITWKVGGALTITSHEDFTWVQFTGLLDKNGKEIWEGDIVRDGTIFIVQRISSLGKIHVGYWGYGKKEFYAQDDMLSDSAEVIGNIFENPELINI